MAMSRREFNTAVLAMVGGSIAGGVTLSGCSSGGSGSGGGSGTAASYKSHADLEKAAKAEKGTLQVATGSVEETNAPFHDGFLKKYPWASVSVAIIANDATSKELLELQSGSSKNDLFSISPDQYADFVAFAYEADLLGMSKTGVLDIPTGMIDPKHRGVISMASEAAAIVYNKNMVSEAEAPKTYDDFLDPKWKGKFLVNIEGDNFAALMAAWGQKKTIDYCTKVKDNKPVWTDSDTAGITRLAAGDVPLALLPNYHSSYKVQQKGAPYVFVGVTDPVPVALTEMMGIRKDTKMPATAILFMEYLASDEVATLQDKYEYKGSLYRSDSKTAEVTKGHQISLNNWKTFATAGARSQAVQKAWGFPSVKKK